MFLILFTVIVIKDVFILHVMQYDLLRIILFFKYCLYLPAYLILIFSHLKLCLAASTDNFKWLKITYIII